MGQALRFRRTEAGLRTETEPPQEHVLAPRVIARELAQGTVRVFVEFDLIDGPLRYELTGFEPILTPDGTQAVDDNGDLRWNWTGWRCEKSGG